MHLSRSGRKRLGYIAGALIVAAALLPWLIWEIPLLLSPFEAGHTPVDPAGAASGLLLAWAAGPTGLLGAWAALPLLFLMLAGVAAPWLAPGRVQGRAVAFLAGWLGIPVAGLLLISLGMPLFSERYLIFVAPAAYLLAAAGASALWERARPAAILAGGAAVAVGLAGVWLGATVTIKPDFRAAAGTYAAGAEAGDAVLFLIPQGEGAFAPYVPAGAPARYLAAPYADGLGDEELDAGMRELLAGSRRVWLVESEAELWDREGRVRAWLAEHGRPAGEWEYHLVRLSLWEM